VLAAGTVGGASWGSGERLLATGTAGCASCGSAERVLATGTVGRASCGSGERLLAAGIVAIPVTVATINAFHLRSRPAIPDL
jgi:hypothetical protein